MFCVAVTIGPGIIQFLRVTHADQVDCDAPPAVCQLWHDIAPEIRRSGITVLEHDRIARAHLNIGHALAIHRDSLLVMLGR